MHILRELAVFCTSMALAISLTAAPDSSTPRAKLSAAEIVDKNVAARGGLHAWRAVETLSLAGKMGAGGNQRAALAVPILDANADRQQALLPKRPAEEAQLPFLLELKRPHEQRLELQFRVRRRSRCSMASTGGK